MMTDDEALKMAQQMIRDFETRAEQATKAWTEHGISVHPREIIPEMHDEPLRSKLVLLMTERKLL